MTPDSPYSTAVAYALLAAGALWALGILCCLYAALTRADGSGYRRP